MPILSVRAVRRPRVRRHCSWCERLISGPTVRLFGMADAGDKPHPIYFHPGCLTDTRDERVRAAVVALSDA